MRRNNYGMGRSFEKEKEKSTVNQSGNYTKPAMRKRIFQRIKRELRAVLRVNGLLEKHKCWLKHTKRLVVAIVINWRSILKREEKPRVRTLSNGKKYLFISEGRAYPFIPNHPILGDRTGRKQKGAMVKTLGLEEIRNDISKAKTKRQQAITIWGDEEWGSQKQHKARARGETPLLNQQGDLCLRKV